MDPNNEEEEEDDEDEDDEVNKCNKFLSFMHTLHGSTLLEPRLTFFPFFFFSLPG